MKFGKMESLTEAENLEVDQLDQQVPPEKDDSISARLKNAWDAALKLLDNLDLEKQETETDTEDIEKDIDELKSQLASPDAIKELIDKHPEKSNLWEKLMGYMDVLQDPDSTPLEKNKALSYIDKSIKGAILELAVKDYLGEKGLDIADIQHTEETEEGPTKLDVLGTNNTDKPIQVFGIVVKPGEQISVECKCGGKTYLSQEFNEHLPKQLSGHLGHSVLLTTSDIELVDKAKVDSVCSGNNTTLIKLGLSEEDIVNAIKGVDFP